MVLRTIKYALALSVILSKYHLSEVNSEDGYCLSDDDNPYLFFSSKTSYDVTRGDAGSHCNCTPIQFWTLNRHGTRYASTEDLEKMKQAADLRAKILINYAAHLAPQDNKLCDEDLQAITNWKWNDTIDKYGNKLSPEGWRELKETAQRYKMAYKDLLSNYSKDMFYFRHDTEERTWASCRSFIEGLFGSYDGVKIEKPKKKDEIIRPYKMCAAWLLEVGQNKTFLDGEKIVFRQQTDYIELLQDVSQRLGFKKILKYTDIDIIYDNCRYEKAWSPKILSAWCSVFTKQQLRLLEYYHDLKNFYESGYGHRFNSKLGCMPLKNMMEAFSMTISKREAKPKVIALFSHDTLINMVFTALNVFKDEKPLKGTDYRDLLYTRKFRCSWNSPFAANIAVVLHRCKKDDYKIQFLLNEQPMKLEGCPKGLCSWEKLKIILSTVKYCNLDFCNK